MLRIALIVFWSSNFNKDVCWILFSKPVKNFNINSYTLSPIIFVNKNFEISSIAWLLNFKIKS